jgi:CheY-like chemotaxis protein
MQAQSAARSGNAALSLRAADGRRPKLLLAEDCDEVRIVTAAMLKGMGCDVAAAEHGEEAVTLAGNHHFDVIVLDIEMPVMDGITAAKSIRRMGGECLGTPLMALSAFLADATQQATWGETFDIALPKPANKNELHAAVHRALSWTPARDMMARFVDEPLLNQGKVVGLRTGLTDCVWSELVAIACHDIEACMVEIEDLVARRDYAPLPGYAFKLRAIGRTFAAPRLSRAATLLELATSRREVDVIVGHLRAVIDGTIAALAA